MGLNEAVKYLSSKYPLRLYTWVQPSDSNHSRKPTNSRAVVPNVRICFWTFPSRRTINKQATTVA